MVKNLDQTVNNWSLNAQLLCELGLHHCPDDLHVDWDVDSGAVELIEVVHGLWLSIGSDNDFDIFGEILGQPEWDVALLVGASVDKVVNALKDKDNFAEDLIDIFDDLSFDLLITDIQPVGKVVSEFFFMEFYFLSDIEFLSELD